MKPTVIAVLTLIGLLCLVKFFPWRSGKPPMDPPGKPGSLLDADPGKELPPKTPGDTVENGVPEPPKVPAEKAVRDLIERRLPTAALQWELMVLGQECAREGIESVKSFVLALPPGSSSLSALSAAVSTLPVEELPAMLTWLATQKETPGWPWVSDGIRTAFRKWVKADIHAAVAFLVTD